MSPRVFHLKSWLPRDALEALRRALGLPSNIPSVLNYRPIRLVNISCIRVKRGRATAYQCSKPFVLFLPLKSLEVSRMC